MPELHSDKVHDVATSSNFKQVKTKHLHLDFKVDFDQKIIKGLEKITLESLTEDLKLVILDVHETLSVANVKASEIGAELPFELKKFTSYGKSLHITLDEPKQKGVAFDLFIDFVSGKGPSLCWLEPQQTADKKQPFLYSQGQSVLNRSFFPCQDTPAVKATYSAFVSVPDQLTAVMSANHRSFGEKANKDNQKNCFYFEQTVPIPSYLIALAVGDLKSAEIGPRSCVWAEPSILEKARAEFDGDVEKFITTGEQLFGDYIWGRYDILVMPPSFPYGGMENPCLTFVTPCLIVGDKSLVDVVIHEITHSWFGNLVTNANWSEFWLNEGFTMFGQRRIEEILFGKARMCLEAITGRTLLEKHIEHEGQDHPLTRLRVVIGEDVDPDDTYNETPYEKGFAFVCYMRSLVGDDNKFDQFLKSYVNHFKFQSVVAEDLFDFYLDYFPQLKTDQVHERPGFEFDKTWLQGTGLPPFTPDLSARRELTDEAEQVADQIIAGQLQGLPTEIEDWGAYKTMYLLDLLATSSPLPKESIKHILEKYSFLSLSQNAEIRLRWCELVIKNNIREKFEDVRKFLHSQGKQKYTLPIYKDMMKGSEEIKKLATEYLEETKNFLHVNVRERVEDIIQKGS
ncbi:aminopeptidase B-like [Physella acuta]|uniref:aminopeptidase B-like n=1 Tax=Physella acuta TaxID=109671 RepID=UPI0027DB11EC|nr:aminopeptidase B-like [Physella acuta]XP_059151457.1 aminopeptidase B-like [Physella acuta]XP_059151458.1 aminopeptidase B-like [Physella acuta]XP_059151459.1 aminopeptidase B-like [Physella acuta]